MFAIFVCMRTRSVLSVFSFALSSVFCLAQSSDPFSSYANLQAPVESFRMTQFGNVSPSLYPGGTLKPLRYITDRIGSVALLIDLDTAPLSRKPYRNQK